jgi:cytochrome c peroxidase
MTIERKRVMTPHRLVLIGLLAGTLAGAAGAETLTVGDVTLELPLGLQATSAYVPEDNPPTPARVALGRMLYFDARLSKDGSVSCAACHVPSHGFAEPRRTSTGVGGKFGTRNAPTVLNRLFSAEQFWDGRARDLEEQSKGPLVNPVEMAMSTHDVVVKAVRGVPGYAPLFEKAFGSSTVTIDRIAQAIASYERTVLTGDSPFDRHEAGDASAMSEAAKRGMGIFNGKGNCVTCHAGFNFTDEGYHNLGVGMDAEKPDLGRYDVTKVEVDRGAFKTPTLRNVTETAPYMHDGSEATLAEVIDFYDRGGLPNPSLSKEIRPLGLTADEKADLLAFLEALTGPVKAEGAPEKLPE